MVELIGVPSFDSSAWVIINSTGPNKFLSFALTRPIASGTIISLKKNQ